MSISSIYYRTAKTIQNRLIYPAFLHKNVNHNMDMWLKYLSQSGVQFHGEPRNHNYSVYEKKLCPSFKLFERWNSITSLIPKDATSLLDMACCRGFYVLQSVLQNNITRAVGVDIDEEYINDSNNAKELMQNTNANFYKNTMAEVLENYEQWGGKFDVVLLTGAYHYFYWGSRRSDQAFHNHDVILSRLALLCQDTLIISARFDVQRLPKKLRDMAVNSPDAENYTLNHFLDAAKNWFDVTQKGMLGEYPLYILKKKPTKSEKVVELSH